MARSKRRRRRKLATCREGAALSALVADVVVPGWPPTAGIDVGTSLAQHLHRTHLAFLCCFHERRLAVFILRVDQSGVDADQPLELSDVAIPRRVVEG